MRTIEENIKIYKKELCDECPDKPMEECLCGCMRKVIMSKLCEWQEYKQAERDGRLVVLPCGVDLMKIYNELTSVCEGDGVENYTNGYRRGHKNGQIELIRRILNISEGVSHKPEQALKGAVKNE